MMTAINKILIAKNFSNAVTTYDLWAEAHRLLAKKLVQMISLQSLHTAVDLGCGTGVVIRELLKVYPDVHLQAIDLAEGMVQYCRQQWKEKSSLNFQVDDIDHCQFSFKPDVILSNCVFQWLPDLEQTLSHLFPQMHSKTKLIFSELILGSTPELNFCREKLGFSPVLLEYRQAENICLALKRQHFRILHQEEVDVKVNYLNAFEALKSFKGIGAMFTGDEHYSPLSQRELRQLCRTYQHFFSSSDGSVPVTYKVLLIAAQQE